MNALANAALDTAPPPNDQLVATRLLPACVSALMLLPTGLALDSSDVMGLATALLWAQALLLAFGAALLAAAAHERLGPWESRAAPAAGRERVRARLTRELVRLGAIGLSGPLAFAGVLDWQIGELRTLPGVAALLCASLCGGLVLSLGWRGRTPRLLVLPALLLLASLARPTVIEAVSRGDFWLSLTVLGCAGLLWCSLLSPRTLTVCAPPWPQPQPLAWGRRAWARRWRTAPYRSGTGKFLGSDSAPHWQMALVPLWFQSVSRSEWLHWGQAYDHIYAIAGYGLWLMLMGIFAGASLIAPTLHWRHRLAPGSPTAARWARRLVFGSMLMYGGIFGLSLALTVAGEADSARIVASGLGDVLLASSFAAWQRGRRGAVKEGLWILAGLSLGGAGVLALLTGLGVTPQRGPVWLAVQLALIVPFTWAAVRAWSRQDLNAVAGKP